MYELTLQKNLFKYAVQRSIFNRDGSVADVRRSVLVQVSVGDDTSTQLLSLEDFDANVSPILSDPGRLTEGAVVEVWDGRYLFGRRKGVGHYAVGAFLPDPNQTSLF